MTEHTLACNLTVICRDKQRRENVRLRITDEKVEFLTEDGVSLYGDKAVELIDRGDLLMPVYLIETAIVKYRGQK